MAIDKSKIIDRAFLTLGELAQDYSTAIASMYAVGVRLLDDIIENIAYDNEFLFNATTINGQLKSEDVNDWGEYTYLLPADYLSLIKFNITGNYTGTGYTGDYSPNGRGVRFEGEYFYSQNKSIKLSYCRDISVLEYPAYLKNYLVYRLAYELCKTYSTYSDSIGLMIQEMGVARRKIENQEGLGFRIENNPAGRRDNGDSRRGGIGYGY